jgi:hypothetical protein
MSKRPTKSISSRQSRVIGAQAFAAITAVEGLRLSAAGEKRLAQLRTSNLTPKQRRAEVLRAYTPTKGRR